MAGERLILNPVTEASTNAPLELIGPDGSLAHGITVLGHDYPPPPREPQFAGSPDTEGDSLVTSKYGNREVSLLLRVAEPSDSSSTNLATNPRCAVDTTGWTNSGLATMERSLLDQTSTPDGTQGAETALHVVGNSDLDYAYDEIDVTSGQSYTLSAWVYLDTNSATGVRLTIHNAAGAALKANTSTFSTLDTWTRLTCTVTADATATWRFGIQQVGAGAADAYASLFLIENASSQGNYFDGDSPGCDWSGTHHASTSTRPATGGPRFYAILRDLQQIVDRINREGGTFKRVPPGGGVAIFDVVQADIAIPSDNIFVHSRRADIPLTLTCKPFWRSGEWVQQSDHSETTLPWLEATDTLTGGGEVPSLGKLLIDEDQAKDQWWLTWGIQSRYYSSSASAALGWQAESLTALGTTSATAGASGASGSGSNVMRNTDLTTSYIGIVSTQATGGGAHMSHIGTFRVYARLYRPTGNTGAVDVALQWAEGDFRKFTTNDAVSYTANEREGVFTIADLGLVTLSKVVAGTQRWEGRVLARSTVAGDEIDVDCLWLVPSDEGSGVVQAVSPGYAAPTSLVARDEFDQAAGALTGKTLPVGGTWAGAGDADDFQVSGTPNFNVTRTATSDTVNTGRYVVYGSAASAGQTVSVRLKTSAGMQSGDRFGVLARYTDSSNWLWAGWIENAPLAARWSVVKRVAGTVTTLYASTSPNIDSTATLTISLAVFSTGIWIFYIDGTPFGYGYDADLVTAGSLATGKGGIYDERTSATAGTRTYDNFLAYSQSSDAAMFASQSCEIRSDRVVREDSGGTLWVEPTKYEGDFLTIPVAGREDRPLRWIVKASRGDPDSLSDPGIDDISARLSIQKRGLIVPEPT